MIGQLLSYAYVVLVSLAAGLLILRLGAGQERLRQLNWCAWGDVLVILGLCGFGTVLSIWSIWFPLGGWAPHWLGLATIAGGIWSAWPLLRERPLLGMDGAWWRVALVILAVFPWPALCFGGGLLHPGHYDSFLYHAQTIMWNEQYAVVPGLGNLHSRFAFNSSYYLLAAYFGVKMVAGVTLFPLNSFLMLLTTLFGAGRMFRDCRRGAYGQAVFHCILLGLWYKMDIFGSEANTSSPSSDILPGILAYYACLLALKAGDASWRDFCALAMTIVGAFGVTVKLSILPIAAIPLFAVFSGGWQRWRTWLLLMAVGALIMVPWVTRNVVLSGWAVYPLKGTAWFHVDWQMPVSAVDNEHVWIVDQGLVEQGVAKDLIEAHTLKVSQWFPMWVSQLPLGKKTMVLWALISPLMALGVWLFRKQERALAWATLICWGGTVFSLMSVPNSSFRFGFGFVFTAAALAAGCVVVLMPRRARVIAGAAACVGLVALAWGNARSFEMIAEARESMAAHRWMPDVKMRHFNTVLKPCVNFYVRLPDPPPGSGLPADWCGQEPLPCVPYYPPLVEMRGPSLADGFRMHAVPQAK